MYNWLRPVSTICIIGCDQLAPHVWLFERPVSLLITCWDSRILHCAKYTILIACLLILQKTFEFKWLISCFSKKKNNRITVAQHFNTKHVYYNIRIGAGVTSRISLICMLFSKMEFRLTITELSFVLCSVVPFTDKQSWNATLIDTFSYHSSYIF